MISAAVAFAIAFLVALAATPLVRRLAPHIGAVDLPSSRRVHAKTIPRLGGIAVAAAFFAPFAGLLVLQSEVARIFFSQPLRAVGLAVGGITIVALGALDDIRGLRAWHKLWVQLAIALVAFYCGFRIDAISLPLIGKLPMGIFAGPVTALWIVAIVNAMNLIDGLDGLAAGVAFFACLTNFVVGAINGDVLVMLLSCSLGGAILGFLFFNFNPASIFLGDSGSMFLGYVLGTMAILSSSIKSSTTVAILVPLIALGLPIIDTLFAIVRRFLERRPMFSPDRGHIHHRLLEMGISHRRAVLLLYGLCVLLAAGAIAVSLGRDWAVGGALVILSALAIGVTRFVGTFQGALQRLRRRERFRSATAEALRRHVPEVLRQIDAVPELEGLPRILEDFARRVRIESLSVEAPSDAALRSFSWHAGDEVSGPFRKEPTAATYPIRVGGDEAVLGFALEADDVVVSGEVDILLQLIADACEARVARAHVEEGLRTQG